MGGSVPVRSFWKRFRLIIIVLVIAVTAVVGVTVWGLATYYPGLILPGATQPCPSGATSSPGGTRFTIVISDQGFNGSRTAGLCPLLSVAKGQSVTIHLVNNDREMHGIDIAHYLTNAMQLRPGQSGDVTFTADQAGSFLIYCNTGCFAHNYMQNGRLNVTD